MPDLFTAFAFLIVAVILFWPVLFGGRVMVPTDLLFQYDPWRSLATQYNATVPQNGLAADLLLENLVWKRFLSDSLHRGELPLWNPHIAAGLPFLAAGQHSGLYPFSLIFYLIPPEKAFGPFMALHTFLAGLFTFIFLRTLPLGRFACGLGGLVFALSGFMVISVVFPMVIAAVIWLPLLLAIVEKLARITQDGGGRPGVAIVYMAAGAVVLGVQFLAGHVEISYYNLIVLALYSLWRLMTIADWRRRIFDRRSRFDNTHPPTHHRTLAIQFMGLLAGMVILGIGLGGIQLVPMYELAQLNFRQGSASYAEVVGWALPARRIISFLMPDFFGNPSIHHVFNLVTGQPEAITHNFRGEAITAIPENTWGIKNHVEAAAYVGLLPMLLAAIAVIWGMRYWLSGIRGKLKEVKDGEMGRLVSTLHSPLSFFSLLALVSLLFAFGTPLYALLFYTLPGYNQLHSAFRWIYPYTLSMAVLAGIGAEILVRSRSGPPAASDHQSPRSNLLIYRIAWGTFAAGIAGLTLLIATLPFREQIATLGNQLLERAASLQHAFPNGATLYSFEFRNLLIFALFLATAGAVLRISRCPIYITWKATTTPVWQPLTLVIITLELLVYAGHFIPASKPEFLDVRPPALQYLTANTQPLSRLISFQNDKILNANLPWLYGLQDVRAYDSIIPKQYADFTSLIEDQWGNLLYNRIGDVAWEGNLDSQLLDLLGVRYVVTRQTIGLSHYRLVYDQEVKIYENQRALPRAFLVNQAQVVDPHDRPAWTYALKSLNPRESVILDAPPPPALTGEMGGLRNRETGSEAIITGYTSSQIQLAITTPVTTFLVLADSYFPGWQATSNGREVPILRADGNFRALHLGPGEHQVIFRYNPFSLKLGGLASFVAGIALLGLVGAGLWGRFYRTQDDEITARRIAKNSIIPMAAQLLNKLIDMLFAFVVLRLLGPEGQGKYGLAIAVIGYFDIFTNFGLNTLLTREVARNRHKANHYLANTTILRLLLWLASLPVLALYVRLAGLPPDTTAALACFALALIPSNISAGIASVFNAYEKMEYPAAVTVITTLSKVVLGSAALLLGLGFVGLAGASILVNLITTTILYLILVRLILRPRREFSPTASRAMLAESYPLMLNHLLATLFFRIDVPILSQVQGDRATGYYTAAYKFIDGLNIIPAYLTAAIFPLMSRYASESKASLLRGYLLSLKVLLVIAIPISVGTSLIATPIISLVAGPAYLPSSAQALALLIWFLPFSYVNSVTQYVLIAVGQQHYLTRAFLIGVVFNLLANLYFIPRYSFMGAALTTVLSELVLFAPFYYGIVRHVAPLPLWSLLWRPGLAGALMGLTVWLLLPRLHLLAIIPLAAIVYALLILALQTFTPEEIALGRQLLPRSH